MHRYFTSVGINNNKFCLLTLKLAVMWAVSFPGFVKNL